MGFNWKKKILVIFQASIFFLWVLQLGAATQGPMADKILVEKSKRTLSLYQGNKRLKTYSISLGREPVGPKIQQGDGKTPEGDYVIDWRNPNSQFHKSLHISYPKDADIAQARQLGVSPGGMIMIHGLPNGFGILGKAGSLVDWTDGCIAVTNEEMDEIWKLVADGTPIEILP